MKFLFCLMMVFNLMHCSLFSTLKKIRLKMPGQYLNDVVIGGRFSGNFNSE